MVAYNDRRFRHLNDNNPLSPDEQILIRDIREIIWWSTITITIILTGIFFIY